MDELDAAAVQGKITLLPGYDAELTSVTFSIQNEDHTIGNALRYMLMKEYVHNDAAPTITPFFSRPMLGVETNWNSSFLRGPSVTD